MTRDRARAVAVLSTVAIVGGAAGTIDALGAELFADRGAQLLRLYAMNTFGGLVTVVGGLIGVGGFALRSKALAGLAGLLFLGVAGISLIALGQTYNLFGGRASTLTLWLMLGVGFTALAASPEVVGATGPESDEPMVSESRAG